MATLNRLIDGYGRFRENIWKRSRDRFRRLAEDGQAPKVMVISCCDSRVDPGEILDSKPGELFVVRNVANLVPPYEPDSNYHGTSSALEFAVKSLQVEHILVLGHARCGGIAALLEARSKPRLNDEFIGQWMSIAEPAHHRAPQSDGTPSRASAQRDLEQASVLNSLDNLKTFPFVRTRLEAGTLEIHGWYFDIATGTLMTYDSGGDCFTPLDIA